MAKVAHAKATSSNNGHTVYNAAKADSSLAMFVKHVNKAGLMKTLEGKGPFTVFAPDNNAFNSRTQADMTAMHNDSTVLISTMKYHVMTGKALSLADLKGMNGQTLTMDNGQVLPVMVTGDKIMVGNANITGTGIMSGNGVIYVVDAVVMPGKAMEMKAAPMTPPMPMGK